MKHSAGSDDIIIIIVIMNGYVEWEWKESDEEMKVLELWTKLIEKY